MPTIEIASIKSQRLDLNQDDFQFAIIEENKLESHRGLFYEILKKQKGTIVHIGNPEFICDKETGFFGGKIIDWDFEPNEIYLTNFEEIENDNVQNKFKILEQYKIDVDKLLKIALKNSPIKKIYFLTDYQFGPKKENIEIIYTVSDFWTQHDSAGLNFNTLYEIYGE